MTFSEFSKTALCRIYQTAAYVPGAFVPVRERAILKGTGCIRKLPVYIKKKSTDKVLVVTDAAIHSKNMLEPLLEKLSECGIEYTVFAGAGENTTALMAEKCADVYVSSGSKAMIAVGGGSVIDCAKLAGIKAVSPKRSISGLKGMLCFQRKTPALYAVPTTAGTGSEAGIYAACYDKKQKSRNIVKARTLRPEAAVLDPSLIVNLPGDTLAQGAMSALCRAVESYLNAESTKAERNNAMLAARLIFLNITKACKEKDANAISELQKASYLAGEKAGYAHFGALTVSASCRVSYAQAAAVLLSEVLTAYGEKGHKKLARLAESISIKGESDSEKAEAFIAAIRELNARLMIPAKLRQLKKNSIPRIASEISSCCNPGYGAPKQLFYDDICKFLQKVKG